MIGPSRGDRMPDATSPVAEPGGKQLIRDLPVRLAHWGLVASVSGSFASHYVGASAFAWHVRFGYATLCLVAFRIAWGFFGSRYARFQSWLRAPVATGAGDARAALTPLGGWMALALLALLLGQAVSGLFANDEMLDAGPLSGWAGRGLSNTLSSCHEVLSSVLIGALALHLGAALFYLFVREDDRITPLVTGYRRGLAPLSAIDGEHRLKALAVLVLIALALALVVALAPAPLEL